MSTQMEYDFRKSLRTPIEEAGRERNDLSFDHVLGLEGQC